MPRVPTIARASPLVFCFASTWFSLSLKSVLDC